MSGNTGSDGSITFDTRLDTSGFKKGTDRLNNAVASFSRQVSTLGKQLQTAFSKGAKPETIEKLRAKMADAEHQADTLRDRMLAFERTEFKTEAYENVLKEFEKLDDTLGKLTEKQKMFDATGVDKKSAQYKKLQYEIKRVEQQLDEVTDRRNEMEDNGTATTIAKNIPAFQELTDLFNSTDDQLSSLGSRLASFGGIGSRAVGFVRDEMKNLAKQTLQAYINLMKMAGKAVVNGLKKLYSGAMKATKALLALNSSSKKSNMGFQHGLKTLLKYGLGIRSLFVLFNRLRAAIKESFQYIAQFDKPTNKVISSLLTALNRLKNSLGAAFQPIVTAVGPYLTMLMNMMSDAMTKVAEFMAMLTGQSYYLKATAVQTDYAKSLEKTTKATNKNANATKKAERQLASFDKLNILSGNKSKDTNTGANEIDPTKDPSKMFQKIPVSGVSDLLKRLREAFANGDYEGIGHIIGEKLNGVFARLSDLVKWDSIGPTIKKYIDLICGVINGMVDSIDWPLIGSTFANGINSLLNSLYLLVTGIRWDEMGAAIGQGLSAMAAGIDWETFGATLAHWLLVKLQLLAGAVGSFDWVTLGANLAIGLNSFVSVILQTIEGIPWAGLVASIVEGLNSLVSGVDWTQLGELIGFWMGTVLATFATAITTFDWETLGMGLTEGINSLAMKLLGAIAEINWIEMATNLTTGINSAIDGVDWELLGSLLGTSVNSILDFIYTTLSTFDWVSVGTNLCTFLLSAIDSVDWSMVSGSFSEFVKGVFDSLKAFIIAFDPKVIGDAVVEFVKGIDFAGIAESAFELLGAALGKAFATLGSLIGGLISSAFTNIKQYFSEKIEACGGDVVAGIFKGITDALIGVGKWIRDHIFIPFINGFKSVFGIHSPSTVMKEMGGYIIDGLKQGISGLWEAVKGYFTDAWTNIKNVFLNANIADWFTTNVWNKITGVFSGVKDWFSNMASNIWSGLTEGLSSKVEDVKEKVKGSFQKVWNGVLSFFGIHSPSTLAADAAGNVLDGFSKGAEDNQASAGQRLKSVFSGIYDAAKSVWDGVTGWFKKLFGGGDDKESKKTAKQAGEVASGISDAFAGVENSVAQPVEKGVERGQNAFANLKVAGEDAAKFIKTTMTELGTQMTTTLTSLLTNLTSKLQLMKSTVSRDFQIIKTTMVTFAESATQTTDQKFSNTFSNIMRGADSMESSIRRNFDSISNSISWSFNEIRYAADGVDWWGVGDNIVAGIQRGVIDNWRWLRQTVRNLAISLYNTARNALGIHSPSRLFRDGVGKMLGLGVAEGMEDSEGAILDSITDITETMAGEMQKADTVASLGVEGNQLLTGLDDVLTTFSDKVSGSFTGLTDRLAAITNSVAFRVPAVAAGAVVPYSVSAKSGGGSEGFTDALVASNDDLSRVIIQATNNAVVAIVHAIETYCGKRDGLTKKEIADMAIDEINRRTRMQGTSPIRI